MNTGDSRVPFAAARAVAAAHGVRCDDAVVIAAGSNVLVHLKPSPVVARVMTGTAALHGDIASWLEREVAVGVFVAERGGPVVPPSDLLAPGPYQDHRLWMTLWKFVAQELADGSPDARAVGHSLREVGGMANAAVSEEGVDAFEPVIPVQSVHVTWRSSRSDSRDIRSRLPRCWAAPHHPPRRLRGRAAQAYGPRSVGGSRGENRGGVFVGQVSRALPLLR